MKKLFAVICTLLILASVFAGCEQTPSTGSTATPVPTPVATEPPQDITEKTDYVTERWVAVEIPFTANTKVQNTSSTQLDVVFTNRSTGTTMTMPGFWDGAADWKVRFAPTECGIWDYATKTTGDDIGINDIKGTIACNAYKGDKDIYKHGFVKTDPEKRYFVYADGTPFFYLGDTHWNMVTEEFDKAGPNAGDIQTDSHFKYIVDRRVEQGFTVYQSEPIGFTYNVTDGKISASDVKGFQIFDKYFKYIADAGLVHANAQLVFPSNVNEKFNENLEELTRYWIARYGAYPVMWTLGQEVDDAANMGKFPMLSLVYVNMISIINEIDPYKSPASAHQLNAASVGCKGGVAVASIDGGYNRIDPTATARKSKTRMSAFIGAVGHTWWASQWRPVVHDQYNFGIPKDYWENGSGKPIVDYEARYHYLYGGDFCMRAQAWIAYLSGMYGHAYGGADMWLYQGRYATDEDAFDGIETITVNQKIEMKWSDLINAPISNELTYLRGFMESVGWWNLIPDFDYGNAFKPVEGKEGFYAAAHTGDEVYVVYLYNKSVGSAGKLVNMDKNATYIAQWFDTRTGEYSLIDMNLKADANGEYDIPQKPVADDMVLLVTKK